MQLSRSKWKRSGVVALALLALLALVAEGVFWLGSTLVARVAVAPAYEPFAQPLWKIGAILYQLHAWIRDHLVYH
jgi:ABC-type cobalt transport system substrate-binding protein